MSAIRDLIVSIDFDDIDIGNLTRVDSAMDQIEDQFRNMGGDLRDASSDFGNLGDNATDALNDIRTDTDRTTGALDDLTDQVRDAGDQGSDALDDLGGSADDATNATEDLERQMRDTGGATNSLGGSIGKLIGIVGAFIAVDKIKDLAMNMIEASASAKATTAQFTEVFGDFEAKATISLEKVAGETQVLSGRLKGSFLGMAAFAKTTGMDTAGALELTERATLAAADGAAFYDKSIEEVSDSLQSFLKGNFANDAALGISATETTRNATANKLYGKSFKKLSESQKQLTLLQMVEDGNKLSGALGQASREGDGFENVVGNLKQSWTDLMSTSGDKLLDPVVLALQGITAAIIGFDPEPVLNFLEKSVEYGGKAVDVLFGVKDTVMALIDGTGGIAGIWEELGLPPGLAGTIEMVAGVIGTVLGGAVVVAKDAFIDLQGLFQWGMDNIETVSAVILGLGTAFVSLQVINGITAGFGLLKAALASSAVVTTMNTIATQGLNAAMRANPIGFVITGIGLLVTAGVLLYQNWDTVTAFLGAMWVKVQEVFGGIFEWGKTKIEPVTQFFGKLGDKFDNFKNKITNFKMPEWVTNVGGKISGAVASLDGSHASGLFNVPYDGYTAELHAGESVLTATQSEGLRAAGILTESGGKPVVGMGGGGSISAPGGGGGGFNPSVVVHVNGGDSDDTIGQKVAAAVQVELAKFWRQMSLKQA